MAVSLEKKPDPRLARFTYIAKIVGGAGVTKDGLIIERAGWASAVADLMGVDKGHMSKILAGHRSLTVDVEKKLLDLIVPWREDERRRHRIMTHMEAELRTDIAPDTVLDNDGPLPGMGG